MSEQKNSEPLGRSTATSSDLSVRKISIPATNASQSPTATPANAHVNEVKTFFTKNLLQIIRAIFWNPIMAHALYSRVPETMRKSMRLF